MTPDKLLELNPTKLILLAPVIFVLHVIEEAPEFVEWFNSLVTTQPITQQMFINVNIWGFLITLGVTAMVVVAREKVSAYVALCWLGTVMFANAIFHITATVALGWYAPGVVTATLLYLPFFGWFLSAAVKRYQLSTTTTAIVVAIGAAPMLLHGYRIAFEGRRLF